MGVRGRGQNCRWGSVCNLLLFLTHHPAPLWPPAVLKVRPAQVTMVGRQGSGAPALRAAAPLAPSL